MAALQMAGAEMVIKALVDQGVDVVFGYPGGAVLPIYDALFKQNRLRHILVRHEQARGARRRRLCALDRQGRRGAGDQRPRRHQRGDRPHRRADGFGAAGLPHRPGADASDRQRRLPGGRHHRHHAALHQAQLPGEGRRTIWRASCTRRSMSRAPAGRGRWWSICRRTFCSRPAPTRRPTRCRAQDLPPADRARSGADRGGGRADRRGEAAAVLWRRRHHQFRRARLRSSSPSWSQHDRLSRAR